VNTLTIDRAMVNKLHLNYEAIFDLESQGDKDIAYKAFQVSGANAINDLITDDEINPDTANLVLGSLVDLQVRDYAIGITDESNRDKLINIWSELTKIAPAGAIAPVATLCAVANYEAGNEKTATEWLSIATADDREYALTKLIVRVIQAGWGSDGFAVMRKQLHPKVVATIYGNDENNQER